MQTTISSDQARINWRDTIDTAFKGDEVVIERYSKPVAVVVSYEEWQRRFTQKQVEAIISAQRAKDAGEPTISHDELKKLMIERHGSDVFES